MDFSLSDEQQLLIESVRAFAQKELAAGALERAHDPSYPWDVARLLAGQSLLGLTLPEPYGAGASLLDAVLVIQELALVCPTSADVMQAGSFGAIRTLAEYASDELKERFLPDLIAGRSLIALAMSEPDAGSAATDLRTTAAQDGSEYVLNGTKIWSTHSHDATMYLVYVRYGTGLDGIGSVLIERDRPGLTVGPPQRYMSGEQWCELVFTDCRIPASNVLLGRGGFKRQIQGFNVERIGNAARALALGSHAYEVARQHAASRQQFGRTLNEFQGIQWKFAEMAVKLDAAQLLLYKAAAAADHGLPGAYETRSGQVRGQYRRVRGGQRGNPDHGSDRLQHPDVKNRIAEVVFDRRFSQRGPA